MTTITLSIDENTHELMRKYSTIKWNEFLKKSIQQRVEELEHGTKVKSSKKMLKGIVADESLLAENWLSEEDNEAWKDL